MQGDYSAKYSDKAWFKTGSTNNGYSVFYTPDDGTGAFRVGQVCIFDGIEEMGVYEDGVGVFSSPCTYYSTSAGWTNDPNAFISVPSGYQIITDGSYIVAQSGTFMANYEITGVHNGFPIFQCPNPNTQIPAGIVVEVNGGVYYGWIGGFDDVDPEDAVLNDLEFWINTDYGYSMSAGVLEPCDEGEIIGDDTTLFSAMGIIPTTGWVVNSGCFGNKINLPISGVLETDSIDIFITNDDLVIAQMASLSVNNDSYDGGITLYCKTIPTAPINFTYRGMR